VATYIDRMLAERRTLQQAVAEIRAKYEREHDPDLAEMIRNGEAEILDRTSRPPPHD
jgi:response regulator RpfG family c-di-GMP phosphodiesterase